MTTEEYQKHMKKIEVLHGSGLPAVDDLIMQGNNGTYELQPDLRNSFEDEGSETYRLWLEASELWHSVRDEQADANLLPQSYSKVISLYQKILSINPFHTHALAQLALIISSIGDLDSSIDLMIKAIKIEPNSLVYQRNLIAILVQTDKVGLLLTSIKALKRKFYYCHDYDKLAIEAYLAVGAPQDALLILNQWPKMINKPENLETSIEVALLAQARSKLLIEQAREFVLSKKFDGALESLEKAFLTYGRDPLLMINLGLALLGSGDFKRSTELLLTPLQLSPLPPITSLLEIVCLANAAFAKIASNDYEAAITLLEILMSLINAEITDDLKILPGRTKWIEVNSEGHLGVIEEPLNSALHLMEFAVEQYSKTQTVPDSVSKLIALYRKATNA